mmetsp:Transcript_127319/g.407265  ORF Transcript_127319/g.407265 Transcript_127319/m.407265 type:complete len:275 (+) Transcript_127319:1757-2581(+)
MAHPQILQLPATAHQHRQRCRKLHQKLGLCRPRRLPMSPAAAAPAAAMSAAALPRRWRRRWSARPPWTAKERSALSGRRRCVLAGCSAKMANSTCRPWQMHLRWIGSCSGDWVGAEWSVRAGRSSRCSGTSAGVLLRGRRSLPKTGSAWERARLPRAWRAGSRRRASGQPTPDCCRTLWPSSHPARGRRARPSSWRPSRRSPGPGCRSSTWSPRLCCSGRSWSRSRQACLPSWGARPRYWTCSRAWRRRCSSPFAAARTMRSPTGVMGPHFRAA